MLLVVEGGITFCLVAYVLRSPLRFSGVATLTGINASLASCNIKGFFQQWRRLWRLET
jgi:hypothetical protein